MARVGSDSPEAERIDAALAEWRQGDAAFEEQWFTHVAEPALALTPESAQAEEGLQAITSEVAGLVIVTQTCDVVRSCVARPFVDVAPLVQVSDDALREAERGRRPAHAFVPAFAERQLVVDLDRIMTVEKSVVASWTRTPGCMTDRERRALALSLARKRARVAFHDDFSELARDLMRRLSAKHDKDSDEGHALRSLREIRVRAAPGWAAVKIELTLWFIRNANEPDFEGRGWGTYLDSWLKRLAVGCRFTSIEGALKTLDDLTAREYLESDPFDLDHLSAAIEPA